VVAVPWPTAASRPQDHRRHLRRRGYHGGGAFSAKTHKVDRTTSYMLRHVAKNVVAAGLAKRCEVQVAYSIGLPDPLSIMVYTYGTASFRGQAPEHHQVHL